MPSVVLLGSKPGSVVALSVMLEQGWDVQYVVVPPNYSSDWIAGPTLEQFALSKGLKVLHGQKQIPPDTKVDFVVSYMYRNLVTAKTIGMAGKAAVNFHAGPLPEFGGWAFYNVAILENVQEYGCTCHYMDNSFDTGPILKVGTFPVRAQEETAVTLERKTQKRMIELFVEFCDMVNRGEALPIVPQEPSRMRYMDAASFKKLKEIPSDADAETIDRYARAFWYPPYECAYTFINNIKVEVIPEIAKLEIAGHLHYNDYNELLAAAATRRP